MYSVRRARSSAAWLAGWLAAGVGGNRNRPQYVTSRATSSSRMVVAETEELVCEHTHTELVQRLSWVPGAQHPVSVSGAAGK